MEKLIKDLTKLIIQDNAIFFIGNNLQPAANQPGILTYIGNYLAQQIEYTGPETDFSRIVQKYEAIHERIGLIRAIKEALAQVEEQPTDLYEHLANSMAQHTKIITTRFDQVLETALRRAHKKYVLIMNDNQVSSFDEARVSLIKIRGDINQEETLVITADDIEEFFDTFPAVNDVVRAFFATKTLIFLGYDLNNEMFERLFRKVSHKLKEFRRPAYAIMPTALDEGDRLYWKKKNVIVYEEDISLFLQKLAASVFNASEDITQQVSNPLEAIANPPRPSHPYKLLESFSWSDNAIFVGRRGAINRLSHRILAHNVTTFYGESGSGKTSLLQAGVSQKLAQYHETLLVVGTLARGVSLEESLRNSLLAVGQIANFPLPNEDKTLHTLLYEWQGFFEGPIVLALDQFEQFWIGYDEEQQETAVSQIRALLVDKTLDIRIIITIREDFLGRLQELKGRIPDVLDILFRLSRLETEAARNAIEKPAKLFNVHWEDTLVDRLLTDLQADHQIMPAQLQIVCTQLYDDPQTQESKHIYLQRYEDLGGSEKILGDYINQVLQKLPLEQKDAARLLLATLVSSEKVKIRLPLPDLLLATNLDEGTAVPILNALTEKRLLQRYELGNRKQKWAFELTHDYLARRISEWLGNEFWDKQRVRELLRTAVPSWENPKQQRLLSPGELQMINRQRGEVNFSPIEKQLIFASAVAYNQSPDIWQADLDHADVCAVLLIVNQKLEEFIRINSTKKLAACTEPAAVARLQELILQKEDAQIQITAVQSVAKENNKAVIAELIKAIDDSEPGAAAKDALITMRDQQTAVHDQLPENLQAKIQRGAWRKRARRNRQVIFNYTGRGLLGGFLGVGTGLALIILMGGSTSITSLFQIAWVAALQVLLGSIVLSGFAMMWGPAAGALVKGTITAVSDNHKNRGAWLASSLTTGLVLGICLALLSSILPTNDTPLIMNNFISGFWVGFVTALTVLLPIHLPKPLLLTITVIVAIANYLLINVLQLSFNVESIVLVVAGVFTGIGMFGSLAWSMEGLR